MKLINTFITCHMLFKWGSSLATKSNTTSDSDIYTLTPSLPAFKIP